MKRFISILCTFVIFLSTLGFISADALDDQDEYEENITSFYYPQGTGGTSNSFINSTSGVLPGTLSLYHPSQTTSTWIGVSNKLTLAVRGFTNSWKYNATEPEKASSWQVEFSTIGYSSIRFSCKQGSLNTAPGSWKLAYKLPEDSAYTVLNEADEAVLTEASIYANANNLYRTFSHILPSRCDNQQSVLVRVFASANHGVEGIGFGTASESYTSINNIVINGKPLNGEITGVKTYSGGHEFEGYSKNPKAYLEYGNDYDEDTRVFSMVLSGENINVGGTVAVALEYKDDYINLCDIDGDLFPEEKFASVDTLTNYTKYSEYGCITNHISTSAVTRFTTFGAANEKNGSKVGDYKLIGYKFSIPYSTSKDKCELVNKSPLSTIYFKLKEGKSISEITPNVINLVSDERKTFYTEYLLANTLNMQSPLFIGDTRLSTLSTLFLAYHHIADRYTYLPKSGGYRLANDITGDIKNGIIQFLDNASINQLIPDLTFTLVTPGSGEEDPEEPEEPDRENYSIVSNLKIYKPVYEDENKNSVSVWASLEDNNDGISDTIGFYYIAAVYDSENKLVDMKIFDKINLTEGGSANTAPLSLSELNIGSTDTVKVFAWNDLTGIKPVAMPAVLN